MRRIVAASLLAILVAAAAPAANASAPRLELLQPSAPRLDAEAVAPPARPAARTAEGSLARLLADSTRRPRAARTAAGAPSFLSVDVPFSRFTTGSTPAARGLDFWRTYGRGFGIAHPDEALDLQTTVSDRLGETHLRYAQRYHGVPVFGHELLLHMRDGAVVGENGDFVPGLRLSTTPALSATDALASARRALGRVSTLGRARLAVWAPGSATPRLAWSLVVHRAQPFGIWRLFVDAHSGDVLSKVSLVETALDRRTFDSHHTTQVEVELVCHDPFACDGDIAASAAHENARLVYQFYFDTFGRDSYDDRGAPLVSNVHFASNFSNAAWIGSLHEMVYGDGDGVCELRYSQSLDVVAHELTHAVTGASARLYPLGQPGALNESYSDVFAQFVSPSHDWLMGEDLNTCTHEPIRDLTAPASMADYQEVVRDDGGVHDNSLIPSHAAYELATTSSLTIAQIEQIYYRALTLYLTPFSDFLDNRLALIQAADDLAVDDASYAGAAAAIGAAQDAVGIVDATPLKTSFADVTPAKKLTVDYGTATTFTGLLVASDGSRVGGRRVFLETDLGTFSDVTGPRGRFTIELAKKLNRNTTWQVTFPGFGQYEAAASKRLHLYVVPRLSTSVHAKRRDGAYLVRVNHRFRVESTTRPNLAGANLGLQYRNSERSPWRTLGFVGVGPRGRARALLHDTARGTRYLRWIYFGSKHTFDVRGAVSPAVKIIVQ